MEEHEQAYLTLQAMVDPAAQTVRWVNKEPQSPAPQLTEFLTAKRQEGWDVMGIAPNRDQLLLILKRPLT